MSARRLAFRALVMLAPPLLVVLALVPMLQRQRDAEIAAWQEQERAATDAARAPFERVFAHGSRVEQLRHCREAILAQFGWTPHTVALAWAPDRIDAYLQLTAWRWGLRRYSCSADGLAAARTEHPLASRLPQEAVDPQPDMPEPWLRMQQLVSQTADAAVIEWLAQPDGGPPIERWMRRVADGWRFEVQPPDAPAFPSLSTTAMFAQAERDPDWPGPLTTHAQRRWSSSVPEAFAYLEQQLPPDAQARIAYLRFDDDEIEVEITQPVDGLDAPYGDINFDAWGAATTWMYGRPEPGFGCAVGRPLAQVRAQFEQRCAELECRPQSHFSIAAWSCSQHSSGAWTLHFQAR
ncbi:MAG: hypothetical protein IT479_13660 [Xanthomonadales bacterium]|nr:hypothetical protein [Xanthomonadales bacterium]MCC6594305.1 hypothetical protein [Xanthomonadales bacterium]MCE7932036.1 hypothetical protein [Xanthomonadales bacterium PRO6]